MIVCLCEGVSERDIEEAAAHGARSLDRLARTTGAGSSCGSCHNALRDLLAAHANGAPAGDRSRTATTGTIDTANPR
mgnify:CR=1 FL=1